MSNKKEKTLSPYSNEIAKKMSKERTEEFFRTNVSDAISIPPETPNWEKEFIQENHWWLCDCDNGGKPPCKFDSLMPHLRQLLRNEREKDRAELCGRIEKLRNQAKHSSFCPNKENRMKPCDCNWIFNQALDQVLQLIKEQKLQ